MSSIVRLGSGVCVLPLPAARVVPCTYGTLVVLRHPVGVTSPASLLLVDDDGRAVWHAERCVDPPDHDPYVDVHVTDDTPTARIVARSARGWIIDIDPSTGRGRLLGHTETGHTETGHTETGHIETGALR